MQNEANPETCTVHGATVSSLLRFLDADVPWVWVVGHMPRTTIQWKRFNVPFTDSDAYFSSLVRKLSYDLQLPTKEFLRLSSHFENQGLLLLQSRNSMPDTLDVERLTGENRHAVLRQNGVVLEIDLPHAYETAVVTSYVPGFLKRCSGA